MKLLRLTVSDFAAIAKVDVEFSEGLNVLYGPNDLGKSTLAEAIRLALLLPHTSSHIEEFVPWSGGRDPIVELTFQTEPQRIWRVRKEFRRGGPCLLRESKNGVDFDDVVRGRAVDGKVRELLQWGLAEPGGTGGSRGLPTSFLATALLSTQSDVTAVLNESLQGDATGTGKDRVAAALQAVAQDPLFVNLLRETQARRDEAYTNTGAKKTAKGSVFKVAAERVKAARDERDDLQRLVDDSEGVETDLRELAATRTRHEAALAEAVDRLATLQLLAVQATEFADATQQVAHARADVERIEGMYKAVEDTERVVANHALARDAAEQALKAAQIREVDAESALKLAEESAQATRSDPAMSDTVARQSLELRRAAADNEADAAQRLIERLTAVRVLADNASAAELENRTRQVEAERARTSHAEGVASERQTVDDLKRVELLERVLDSRAADQALAVAQEGVEKFTALQARLDLEVAERQRLAELRSTIVVPAANVLAQMRRLDVALATARATLNVGLAVTIMPVGEIGMTVRKDALASELMATTRPIEIEADTEIDIDIANVAMVHIRGGRREAQDTARALTGRWASEVVPHLTAAKVKDLDGLTARAGEAQELEVGIKGLDTALESLRTQISSVVTSPEALTQAFERASACRAALGDSLPEHLTAELAALGADPSSSLRKRSRLLSEKLDAMRAQSGISATACTLAEERGRRQQMVLDTAVTVRDAALAVFPEGLLAGLTAAQSALTGALAEQKAIISELAALESTIAAQKARNEAVVHEVRAALEAARTAVEAMRAELTNAITQYASHDGRLQELRRLRDTQDLDGARSQFRERSERLAVVLVPERMVSEREVAEARNVEAEVMTDLEGVEAAIQRAHGALAQVGGAVARERLRDANEAYELAERQERETEADSDAWKLLLEQMKDADAAQASNLGQVLAPAIASRFEALTQQRYESVVLTSQLGTEGVLVGGEVRAAERMSVGTREQLSTLYRLALAEYLKTTVVLDDQLVQSDETRMEWFRGLLSDKARNFQIIVFTCRPGDYLSESAMVPAGDEIHFDTDGGMARAFDLGRAIRRG
jgi:energy-coupling factor transporter ATP-binding protein EcfA2